MYSLHVIYNTRVCFLTAPCAFFTLVVWYFHLRHVHPAQPVSVLMPPPGGTSSAAISKRYKSSTLKYGYLAVSVCWFPLFLRSDVISTTSVCPYCSALRETNQKGERVRVTWVRVTYMAYELCCNCTVHLSCRL